MILNSQRLILRNFKSTDLDDFFYYASQPNVGPNAGWTPHLSKSETKFVLSNFIKNKCEFAIEYNQKVIGSIGYSKDGKRNYSNVYQIGYCLCQDYWGMGLMPEAVECLLEYLFEEIQAELVAVYHFPFNERSKRVILKTGFRYEGTMYLSYMMPNGTIYDEACYSMSKEEYLLKKIKKNINI